MFISPPRGKDRQMGTVVNIVNAGRWRDLEIWAGHGDRYAEAVAMVSSFSDDEGYRKSPRTSVISHLLRVEDTGDREPGLRMTAP